MKRSSTKLIWTPLVSLGPIQFNCPFYINSFASFTLQDDTDPDMDWKTYWILELKTNIFVKDGIVTSCETWLSCIYNETDLIGMKSSDVYELFSDNLTWDDSHNNYFQDDMDITIWIEKGAVESVTVGGKV